MDVRKDLGYETDYPSRLVRAVLKFKRVPKRAYPNFKDFCVIAHHFFVNTNSMSKMPKVFLNVRQGMALHLVGPQGKSYQFLRSNGPRSEHTPPPHFDNFCKL